MQSPTQQRNSFSEGLALGMILNGHREFSYSKTSLDLAVASAYSAWSHASSFPALNAELRRSRDGTRALMRADVRKSTFAFFWETPRAMLRVVDRQPGWSERQYEDVQWAASVIGGGLTSDDWKALAADVLSDLNNA
ncbi:hypothetical protein [Clavibacter michiganensis]|uniref:Uncharacterized protein n=1 Tax=Clavibacter michiganensis subsp. insidiosus TaxID=33014 RepID=A0A399SP84_9MICO|nr:hypothetical protein [Clavibacter michiganensis]OQJ57059.1 hypothetical protein B5P21_15940 [Clavibacter michiganensis subsp. insidiosus]RIJ44142.1 hypothetical protein DZF93_03920 [Clavibacter michiganensis subsp. insidiosus]RMC82701.1 hypothetical protein CmiCFBP2404_15075 [Clavibacter michiganensis subsp. insidiosus]